MQYCLPSMGESLRLIKAGSKHSPIEYKLYGDHLDFTQKTIKIVSLFKLGKAQMISLESNRYYKRK
jgi:hypothetical protein